MSIVIDTNVSLSRMGTDLTWGQPAKPHTSTFKHHTSAFILFTAHTFQLSLHVVPVVKESKD